MMPPLSKYCYDDDYYCTTTTTTTTVCLKQMVTSFLAMNVARPRGGTRPGTVWPTAGTRR